MRKITYLVAPLMVLPFLVGCNKDTTYKVSVLKPSGTTAVHLQFLSEDEKKDLTNDQVRAKKGESFKFRIVADKDGETQYTVAKDLVFVAVNDEVLFDGVEIYWDGENNEEDRTKATVIVEASKITGDIVVGAEKAGIKDRYTFETPYLSNIENVAYGGDAKDTEHEGYYWSTKKLTVTFTPKSGGEGQLGALIDIDGYGYDSPDAYLTYYTGVTINGNTLTIDPNDGGVVPHDSFSIIVRATGFDDQWLNSFTWGELKEISDLGLAPKLFVEGDTKTVKIGEKIHTVRIIGFNHDTLADDKTKTAGITFEFANVLTDESGAITQAWGKSGEKCHQNFIKSAYNDYLNNDTEGAESVINMLPADLKEVIAPVVKKVGVYADGEWTPTDYEPKLFPLAYEEITTKSSSHNVGKEGTIYSYFKTHTKNADRKLVPVDGTTGTAYWLRSPSTETSWGQTCNYAFEIMTTGAISDEVVASTAKGIAPCFCI